jgi:uncharacterized membrane protein
VAHIARSIELDAPVDTIHEEWLRFEALPSSAVHSMVARVRWRAEVLTFEPTNGGTRVTLRVEYDSAGGDAGLGRRVQDVLLSFTSFHERHGVMDRGAVRSSARA